MKKELILSFIVFAFFISRDLFAADFIRAEVDKTAISTDQAIAYKITVNSSERQVPPLQLPKFEGFRVLSTARSSTFSLSAGQLKSTLIYTYILSPQQTGKLKIAPAQIKIKDKIYTTDSFEIEVAAGLLPLPSKPVKKRQELPQRPLPENKESEVTL